MLRDNGLTPSPLELEITEEGCDQLQGYLLCRPLPAQQMTEFLKSQQASHSLKGLLAMTE